MQRLKSICKKTGCNTLIDSPGYCNTHKYIAEQNKRESWEVLDKKKPAEIRAFYNSHKWHEASRRHRITEPLCRRCRRAGKVTKGTLAHHNPPIGALLADGLNPFLDDYLETLCLKCHMKELRAKKKAPQAWG